MGAVLVVFALLRLVRNPCVELSYNHLNLRADLDQDILVLSRLVGNEKLVAALYAVVDCELVRVIEIQIRRFAVQLVLDLEISELHAPIKSRNSW